MTFLEHTEAWTQLKEKDAVFAQLIVDFTYDSLIRQELQQSEELSLPFDQRARAALVETIRVLPDSFERIVGALKDPEQQKTRRHASENRQPEG